MRATWTRRRWESANSRAADQALALAAHLAAQRHQPPGDGQTYAQGARVDGFDQHVVRTGFDSERAAASDPGAARSRT